MKCFVGVTKDGRITFACLDNAVSQGQRLGIDQSVADTIRDGREVHYVEVSSGHRIVIGEHFDIGEWK